MKSKGAIQFIGYDKGSNIKALIDGQPYTFATNEWYGQVAIYGIAYPLADYFTMLSKSRPARSLYSMFEKEIGAYIRETYKQHLITI